MLNILSVDVEEYFHPSEIQPFVQARDWDSLPSRIDMQIGRTLDLLARHNALATFFVVGWVAERHPRVVRRIADAGHEVGSHSYAHRLVYDLTPEEFKLDTQRSMDAIADACGVAVRSYRAPSYSITAQSIWALDILAELGFTHDSSIYPIAHDRYGIPGFPRFAQVLETQSGPIIEVPIATVQLSNRTAPVGGGGYLRLLPYRYTAAGIRKLNIEEKQSACVYFHPWEVDPGQPKLAKGMVARMRTYTGLRTMEHKLNLLLSDFNFSTMTAVYPPAEERMKAIQAFA